MLAKFDLRRRIPPRKSRQLLLQSRVVMRGDGEAVPPPVTNETLYASLSKSLGGDQAPKTSSRGMEMSIGDLLPAPRGVALPDDDTLHKRARNRTLLLDKETSGRHAGGRRRNRSPPRWKALARPAGATRPVVSRKAMRRARSMKISLPKAEQKYAIYEPLAKLWQDYAKKVVGGSAIANAGDKMLRMDFHGAEIEVVRSRDPGLVGLGGILVVETAATIIVVSKNDRAVTVPKNAVIVATSIGERRFEIALPLLPYRASERSARKIKKKHADLF